MKKFGKIIFLCLFIFLYCGCTINYNLVVTNNKDIIEDVTVLDNNDNILKYNDSILDFLNNQQLGIKEEGYDTEILMENTESGLLIKNRYNNFDSYITSEIFTRLFEKANVSHNNGLFAFETSGEYYRNDVFSVDLSKHFIYNLDEININIKFYNVVESHNADKVDEASNTYTWILNKDDSYRNISFKLKDNVRYDVMIKDFINRHKVLVIVIIFGLILLVYGIMKLKKIIKQNNSI